jgi:hypothetical protein
MDVGLKEVAVLGLVLLCGLSSLGLLLIYSAFQELGSGVSINASNFSYGLDDCEPGDSGFVRLFDTTMNLTVTGLTSHRGRPACHSAGLATIKGQDYDMDLYRVGSGDQCFVLAPLGGGNESESCQGDWPGYIPAGQ